MADVKWIKLDLGVFKNRKVEQIEVMPEGDGIIVIWFKLMCLAGTINDNGQVYFTQELPYTEEMLAAQFHRPLQLVRLALHTFQRFGMIEIVDDIIRLSNWEKYQNTDGLQKLREQTRARVALHRSKQRALPPGNVTGNVTVTLRNATEVDKEVEVEGDQESRRSSRSIPRNGGDVASVQVAAQECGLPWNAYNVKMAARLEQTYGLDWLIQAIERSAIRGKQSWGMVEGILTDWHKKGGVDEPFAKRAASGDTDVKWAVGGNNGH